MLDIAMSTAMAVINAMTIKPIYLAPLAMGLAATTGAVQMAAVGAQNYASGFEGTISQPTMIQVGEEGAEEVSIKPRAKMSAGSDKGGLTVTINGDVYGEEKFMEAVREAHENLTRGTI